MHEQSGNFTTDMSVYGLGGKGYVELVDDVEIRPKMIAEYIREKGRIYRIKAICLDDYRYDILRDCLEEIGYSIERKNIILIRPRHIMKIYPIIDRCFANQYFYWGEQPHLRWATNNTKLVRTKNQRLPQMVSLIWETFFLERSNQNHEKRIHSWHLCIRCAAKISCHLYIKYQEHAKEYA